MFHGFTDLVHDVLVSAGKRKKTEHKDRRKTKENKQTNKQNQKKKKLTS